MAYVTCVQVFVSGYTSLYALVWVCMPASFSSCGCDDGVHVCVFVSGELAVPPCARFGARRKAQQTV